MAHWPVGGPTAAWRSWRRCRQRKILIHVNNTNPILREDSPERRLADRAGVEVAEDAMEIDLDVAMTTSPRSVARRAGGAPARGGRAPVSRSAPFPRPHARGPADARAASGAGSLNRYYYQTRIPIKDALIVSKSEDPAFRRLWIRRIHDHDGEDPSTGGLALWLQLAEAVGLDREEVASCRRVLPGVRFACDAYVTLCASAPSWWR